MRLPFVISAAGHALVALGNALDANAPGAMAALVIALGCALAIPFLPSDA